MTEDASMIARLERQLRWTTAGVVVALLIAGVSLLWSPRVPSSSSSAASDTLTIAGGAALEMVGQDLRITLPTAISSIVLQTPEGQEIARLGNPRPQRLGD